MQIILIAILQTILPPSLKKFPLTQAESFHRMGKSQAVLCVCVWKCKYRYIIDNITIIALFSANLQF